MKRSTRWAGAAVCSATLLSLPALGANSLAQASAPSNSTGLLTGIGTASFDTVAAVAVANDKTIYIAGTTEGLLSTFDGEANEGGKDIFVSRIDPSGNRLWTRQFGSAGDDEATSIAVSKFGEVYVVGTVQGAYAGNAYGGRDAVLASFGSSGRRRWAQQIGTPVEDNPTGVAVSNEGDVFVAGWTDGALAGVSKGGRDAFVRRVSRRGDVHWTKQYGTAGDDNASAIALSAPVAVYIAGTTNALIGAPGEGSPGSTDAYVMRIDRHGRPTWAHQFGSAGDEQPSALARDKSGQLFVAGETTGAMDGPNRGETDLFVVGLNRSGIPQWTRQLGTSAIDRPLAMALARNGNLYLGGSTFGSLNQANLGGGGDAFVSRFTLNGQRQWTEQFGTDAMDEVLGVAATPSGDVYAVGYTYGILAGDTNGGVEGFVLRLDDRQNRPWTHQLGPISADSSVAVAAARTGDVYSVGTTSASLAGSGFGGEDAYVAKYSAAGTNSWVRQFGTAGADRALAVAATRGGDVVVVGSTDGALGGVALGDTDAFVARYSRSGTLLWSRQIGTAVADRATSVVVTGRGDIVVSGTTFGSMSTNTGESNVADTQDVFITSFSPTGARMWTRQFGSDDLDVVTSSALAPNGDILLAGTTFGFVGTVAGEYSHDAFDAFVARFDDHGTPLWRRQFGSESNDVINGITSNPAGGFDVAGLTGGTLNEPNQGGTEAFVGHFTNSGELVWLHQFGTVFNDSSTGVVALANGDLVVVGTTEGQLGALLSGASDVFVARFTSAGTRTSTEQFGTTVNDLSFGASSGASGAIYLAGRSTGSLNEDSSGGEDAFVSRLA